VASRLRAAGYTFSTSRQPSAPAVRIVLSAGGSAYAVIPINKITKRQVLQEAASTGGRRAAEPVGSIVYLATSGPSPLSGSTKLTGTQLSEFRKIVAAGSGQG
jgi:hypothetical protein